MENDKKPKGRNELIRWRLNKMIGMATPEVVNSSQRAARACKDQYIRICGESYRAVSLADQSPLLGYSKSGSKDLARILADFNEKDPPDMDAENKPERQLQSWLLREAMARNRGDLLQAMRVEHPDFEKLIFALDEVSLGDKDHPPTLRCDILAVACKGLKGVPVIVELKYARKKKELEGQLCGFSKELENFRPEFQELLGRYADVKIDLHAIPRKMLVWPGLEGKGGTPEKSVQELNGKGIDVVEFSPREFDGNKVKFQLYSARN